MSKQTKSPWQLAIITLSTSFGVFSAGSAQAIRPDPPHDPPLPLPISFSVNGEISPKPNVAEGIDTDPNDVKYYFDNGALSEGEIFQSSGIPPWIAPPDTTNSVRMSSAWGASFAGPGGPCTGPEPILEPGICIDAGTPPFGPGSFGLTPEDNIISLSYGKDSGNVLQFSVDPEADGLPGTDVEFEALLSPHGIADSFFGDEAAGDIFKSIMFANFGSYIPEHIAAGHVIKPADAPPFVKINELYRDELELGLHAPGDEEGSPTRSWEDDLDAFEEADTGDPFWGVDIDLSGGVDAPPPPSDQNAFFSLDALSFFIGAPTISAGGFVPEYTPSLDLSVSADDILVSPAPGFFGIYANGIADIGLLPGDVIDALVLSDVGPGGTKPTNGLLDPGLDEALFSLQEGSPSLLALPGLNPGDVFYTNFTGGFGIYAEEFELGLDEDDELNALDIKPTVPEPSSMLGIMALGLLGAKSALKRKLTQK